MKLDTERRLHVIYCEDVRLEMTGQTSIIGIFNGALAVPTMPITLPKLCIVVEASTPIDDLLQTLTFEVKVGDEPPAVVHEVPQAVLEQQAKSVAAMPPPREGEEDAKKTLSFRTQFFLAPLVINEPTVIKTRMLTERGLVRGVALSVVQGNTHFPTVLNMPG